VRSEGQGDIFGDLSGTELDWYAWKIAACELGYPCGSRSPDVVGYCVNQGICGFGDIREIFRNAILSSVDYQRAEALSQSVLQLINESAT
jgi:hypothetical protein